ncbi:MAG: PLP-dependent aminotransferase family protein [Pseudomonadota bacterium]
MSSSAQNVAWMPVIAKSDGPVYLAIARAIGDDIYSGVLRPGQRLPPQRALAEALGVDFTTVSRAYNAASKDGLVEGRVGQGTYVKAGDAPQRNAPSRLRDHSVDMSMNMPPRFDESALQRKLFDVLDGAAAQDWLMKYQSPGGHAEDRLQAMQWLSEKQQLENTSDLVLCNGVQGAAWSILSQITVPGDTICCEELCYPGVLTLAKHMKLNVCPVAMDDQGVIPEALDAACAEQNPKAFYVTPTLHNPTTVTMSEARRQSLSKVIVRRDLLTIEDDAYGVVSASAPAPLAYFAPAKTWYLASLSKCLAPALRACLVLPPVGTSPEGFKRSIRASGNLISPISASLATHWMRSKLADKVTDAIRKETRKRQDAFAKWLPDTPVKDDAFHVWMPLPSNLSAMQLVLSLRGVDLGVVPAQVFAPGDAPNAVRIAIGSSESLTSFEEAVKALADVIANPHDTAWMVV